MISGKMDDRITSNCTVDVKPLLRSISDPGVLGVMA